MIDLYRLQKEKQTISLEGISYSSKELERLVEKAKAESSDFLMDLYNFLKEWFNDSAVIKVHTSGSTGKPKELWVRKEQMINSARLTCEFLQLHEGDKVLLCMPLRYIAGKMVVVRALVAGLDLILRTPSGHPFADVKMDHLRFTAMIPLQVFNTLHVPEEREQLEKTDILIIGGGAIDADLEREIQRLPNMVFSTYGMTETLSHIALRRLNGTEASPFYHPFDTVNLSLSEDDCLIIDAPLVCDQQLHTNDIARILPDGSFQIIGRKDNTINTGGIKVQIEEVESTLRPLFPYAFAITSVPDVKFGEIVVALVANGKDSWQSDIFDVLPKYQRPKQIITIDAIPLTGSGKIDRAACRKLACNIIKKHL